MDRVWSLCGYAKYVVCVSGELSAMTCRLAEHYAHLPFASGHFRRPFVTLSSGPPYEWTLLRGHS